MGRGRNAPAGCGKPALVRSASGGERNSIGGREYLRRTFYSQIDELIALVEEVNLENVGFCLDVGHANVDGVDIPAAIQRMGEEAVRSTSA